MRAIQVFKPIVPIVERFAARSQPVTTLYRPFFMSARYQSRVSGEVDHYNEIISSLPLEEKDDALKQMAEDREVQLRAEKLSQQIADGDYIDPGMEDGRTLLLSSLKLLQEGSISVAELASIHLLDSAVRTLTSSLTLFSDEERVEGYVAEPQHSLNIQRFKYDAVVYPVSLGFDRLPDRMRAPLVRRFFHFTDDEWLIFCDKMQSVAMFEQYCYAVPATKTENWSPLIKAIQNMLQCFQMLCWLKPREGGGYKEETIMLVPSFTMFQVALEVKARSLNNRIPVHLIPTYGYVNFKRYTELKSQGLLAMAMYLPEFHPSSRYQTFVGRFRTNIDGFPHETAFAGAIHDMYHSFRELAMSENVARARMRLAAIARKHPDCVDYRGRTFDELLVDGELLHSYPLHLDTVFKGSARPLHAMRFGEIFYNTSITKLPPKLHHLFIEDMVKNAQLWQDEYALGRSDLLDSDQYHYDVIKECVPPDKKSMARMFGIVARAKKGEVDSTRWDDGLDESPSYKI